MDEKTGRYAVLIRHNGWIDRFVRRSPKPGIDAANLNAWTCGQNAPESDQVFADIDAATAHADGLAERFGADGYRFSVAEERMVPRWYLANPEYDRERNRAVGSREQI